MTTEGFDLQSQAKLGAVHAMVCLCLAMAVLDNPVLRQMLLSNLTTMSRQPGPVGLEMAQILEGVKRSLQDLEPVRKRDE